MGNVWTDDHDWDQFLDNNQRYDLNRLGRDQFYLTVNNTFYDEVYLYGKYNDCYKCPYIVEEGPVKKGLAEAFILDGRLKKTFRFLANLVQYSFENDPNVIGSPSYGPYQQFGVYKFDVDNLTVHEQVLKEPEDIYFPILSVFLIYLTLAFVGFSLKFLWKYLKFERLDLPRVPKNKNNAKEQKRILSLDTFRGISIVLMIFVNYGQGGYCAWDHVTWNGLQLSDLVFPWFMWIMGACIPISVTSHYRKELSCKKGLINVLKRSCKLFAIGIFLGSGPYLDKMRIMGVLQRFAICYFVVASLQLITFCPLQNNEKTGFRNHFRDLINLRLQWVFMILILTLHTVITFCLEVPGCPKGYLGPGGIHDNVQYKNCTAGAAGYIDNTILGDHIYKRSEIVSVYKSQPIDPEGIFGCLTSIFQVFLGVQAGTILLAYKTHKQRLLRWAFWFLSTGLIGGLLCGFSKEEGLIPLNKNLWSLSFVLTTSSTAFILLSICYILVDDNHLWSGKPFLFAGMNAILMYVGHSMVNNNFPIHWYLSEAEANRTHFLTLLKNVWGVSAWVCVAYYLYKINYFWSL